MKLGCTSTMLKQKFVYRIYKYVRGFEKRDVNILVDFIPLCINIKQYLFVYAV